MKILLVHNFYDNSSPSGENVVFEAEFKMLRKFGHEVETYTEQNDGLGSSKLRFFYALFCLWNPVSFFKFWLKVTKFRPDVIHVHNLFPKITTSILFANRGVPIVMTVHNYRMFCAAGTLLRDGDICELCLNRKINFSPVLYSCYRNSLIASFFATIVILFNKLFMVYEKRISIFILFSEFQKKKLLSAGVKNVVFMLKSNFLDQAPPSLEYCKREDYIVYVGRLSLEKGVLDLIEAWNLWGVTAPKLKIVGTGPLFDELIGKVHQHCDVDFLGNISRDEVIKVIQKSKFIVVPSKCYEGFPLAVAEAIATSTPILCSNVGPLPEFVTDKSIGLAFEGGKPTSMVSRAKYLYSNEIKLKEMSHLIEQKFKQEFAMQNNYKKLINIYDSVRSKRLEVD